MKATTTAVLRGLTRITRPLAMRSAGKQGSTTSVVRHVGRRSGRTFETPVVVAEHGQDFLIALPYGDRTDWMKNVLAMGSAELKIDGRSYQVGEPEVVPMGEATSCFRPKEQRLHRRFQVATALKVRRRE